MSQHAAGTSRPLFPLPFVAACLLMGAAAFIVGPTLHAKGGNTVKAPLPLRLALGKFDKSDLGPYRFQSANVLTAAVEEALGAVDYLDWQYIDTRVKSPSDPLRGIRIFVSYYTGGRDLVPHVPDECYLGQGYQTIEEENLTLDMPALGGPVPVRALTFVKSALLGRDKPTVIYLFHCNGDLVETRTAVRRRINSLQDRFAYFAKIEVSFGTPRSNPRHPDRAAAIAAAAEFLNIALPRLIDEHFPDWAHIDQESATGGDGVTGSAS